MTPQQIAKAAEDREKERQLRPVINGVVRWKPREFTQKELCNVQIMVDALIDELGIRLKPDSGELPKLVNELLKTNRKAIDQYKQGNEKALNSIVGQVMKVTKAYDGAKIIAEIKLNLG